MPDLRIEQNGALAHLIFAREKGLNILSSGMLRELDAAWQKLEQSGVRVCIIRGEGKAFLAGADIKEMAALDGESAPKFAALGQGVFDRIEKSEIVSIAAIHGACLGGGCELVISCDIRMGSVGMLIGQPEVNIGLVPGFGGSQRLARIVGMGGALRIILSGEALDESMARNCGLITDSGDAADLVQRAEKLARTILSRGPQAVKIAKRLVRASLETPQDQGLALERDAFGETFASGEAKEGLTAFIEKRAPRF